MEKELKKQNPWWYVSNWNTNPNFKCRNFYLDKLKKILHTKEILTISGLRRVGKSTLQLQLIDYIINEKKINPKNVLFFNTDIFETEKKNMKSINELYETYLKLNNPKGKIYIFFDEIQNIDSWESWVKVNYDINPNLKFIITGSNSKLLYSNLSKLLTGRIFNINVFPLNFKEFLAFKDFEIVDLDLNKPDIYTYFNEYLEFGGYPEVVLEKDISIKTMRLKEYYNSIILRDVLEINAIKETKLLIELSKYLISNSTKLFSYNKISNILGSSKTTIKEYCSYLEQAYFFYELNKFDYSIKKQIFNGKKIYSADTGLMSAISFKFSLDIGRKLENLVFVELLKREKDIYYNKNKNECDFVLRENLDINECIQVTLSLSEPETRKREITGLLDACKSYKLSEGIILTQDEEDEFVQDGVNVKVLPVWKWLLE